MPTGFASLQRWPPRFAAYQRVTFCVSWRLGRVGGVGKGLGDNATNWRGTLLGRAGLPRRPGVCVRGAGGARKGNNRCDTHCRARKRDAKSPQGGRGRNTPLCHIGPTQLCGTVGHSAIRQHVVSLVSPMNIDGARQRRLCGTQVLHGTSRTVALASHPNIPGTTRLGLPPAAASGYLGLRDRGCRGPATWLPPARPRPRYLGVGGAQ